MKHRTELMSMNSRRSYSSGQTQRPTNHSQSPERRNPSSGAIQHRNSNSTDPSLLRVAAWVNSITPSEPSPPPLLAGGDAHAPSMPMLQRSGRVPSNQVLYPYPTEGQCKSTQTHSSGATFQVASTPTSPSCFGKQHSGQHALWVTSILLVLLRMLASTQYCHKIIPLIFVFVATFLFKWMKPITE